MRTASWRGGDPATAGRSRRPAGWPRPARSGPPARAAHAAAPSGRASGKRLQPDGLVARGRHGRSGPGHVPLPGRAAVAARRCVPGTGWWRSCTARCASRARSSVNPPMPCQAASEDLLDGVLGVGEGSEHPVAVHLQLPPVRVGQLPERLAVPGPRPQEQIGCHHPARLPSAPRGTSPGIHRPRRQLGGSRAPSFPATAVYASPTAPTTRAPDRATASGTTGPATSDRPPHPGGPVHPLILHQLAAERVNDMIPPATLQARGRPREAAAPGAGTNVQAKDAVRPAPDPARVPACSFACKATG